jgi:HSP20 family protein
MNDIVRRNDPFDIFSRFGDLFDREPFLSPASRAEWLPPVDIKETDGGYTFHMDVPGMKPEDLDVELHEGVLSIRGSRTEEKREEDKGYVRTERRHGSFSRQFRVPTNVQADSLKAEVKDGVLTIEVPKGAEQGARKVTVS